MSRLKLRTFSIGILLVATTIGLSLNFSESVVGNADQTFENKEAVNELREGFGNQTSSLQDTGQTESADIQVETQFFYLPDISSIIQSVVGGLGSIIRLGNTALQLTGLNVPPAVANLINIVVLGVIFAVVSSFRGFDT